MADLDFPTSPTVGQQYGNWVWNGAQWDFAQTLPGGLPAGAIMAWGGSTAPVNWLLCDGSAVSRTTYASLFNAVGTSYGVGDGSTTFNLPDLRGRIPVGKNGATFGTIGATGGAETVTLTEAQIPAHTHGIGTSLTRTTGAGSTESGTGVPPHNSVPSTNQDIKNGVVNSTGGGGAHNNLQPYQVVNYIIKYVAAVTPGESELAPRVGVLEGYNSGTRLTALELADSTTNKSGMVPVVPTSVTIGSGTSSVSANGLVTVSGASSVGLNGCFNSSYSNYRVIYNLSFASSSAADIRMRSGATNDASSVYDRTITYTGGSTVAGLSNAAVASWGLGITGQPLQWGVIDIQSPYLSAATVLNAITSQGDVSSTYAQVNGTYRHRTASSYDGLGFVPGTNMSGTIQVYGYR